jgi:hypothetical protein
MGSITAAAMIESIETELAAAKLVQVDAVDTPLSQSVCNLKLMDVLHCISDK